MQRTNTFKQFIVGAYWRVLKDSEGRLWIDFVAVSNLRNPRLKIFEKGALDFGLWKRSDQLTSIIFLLVSDSWGSLYSVYLRRTLSMSVLAYWYSLLLELKIINAISQSHKTDNSYAFFITPNFLLLKVTWKKEK